MKQLIHLFLPLVFSIFLSGCSEKGPHLSDTLNYRSTLNPVAANSEASGVAVLEFSRSSRKLSYNIALRNIKPTRVILAYGEPKRWDNGPVIADLTTVVGETGGSGSLILEDFESKAKLFNNMCYFRVDSEAYPVGELRGQIELSEE